MSMSAEFSSKADRRAYAIVSAGAAALSYYHARTFFLPFMGTAGASVTPLMLDAVVFWLASACVRQARGGRPLPMLRFGAYAVLALAITANALGGATWPERVFMALPAALFGFLTEARIRLALYHYRTEHGDDRIRVRLWVRHPVHAFRAWLWLARQSAPAYDRANAERDRLAAARDAVRLALPGRSKAIRRARRGVLRELNAERLAPAAAVAASGLLDMPGVPALHRAALATALGDTAGAIDGTAGIRTETDAVREAFRTDIRTEIDAVREALRTEITGVRGYVQSIAAMAGRDIEGLRHSLRADITSARNAPPAEDGPPDRDALVAELADEMRDAIAAAERWTPDYEALMKRTGYRRRWCEGVVADARTLAFSAPRTDDARADDHPAHADAAARAEQPRLRRLHPAAGTDETERAAS